MYTESTKSGQKVLSFDILNYNLFNNLYISKSYACIFIDSCEFAGDMTSCNLGSHKPINRNDLQREQKFFWVIHRRG